MGTFNSEIASVITTDKIAGAKYGTGDNYVDIDSGGVITLEGTAKRKLTLRPQLVASNLIKNPLNFVPTPVTLGAFTGYTMPVYNTDEQELYFRMRAPYRWDGVTNPNFKMIVALAGAEDVGDKFRFDLDWNTTSVTGAIEADVLNVPTTVTVIADHTAQYSTYSVAFELDYDNAGLQQSIAARNIVVGRVRRVAAEAPQVSNAIIILDWVSEWYIDKLYGTW